MFINTTGGSAGTIEGRASTIRGKATNWKRDADASHWLNVMAAIFALPLKASSNAPLFKKHEPEFRRQALVWAAQIGETRFAIDTVLPMLDIAFNSEKDSITN